MNMAQNDHQIELNSKVIMPKYFAHDDEENLEQLLDYRVHRVIGTGSFSKVYLASDSSGKQIALKQIPKKQGTKEIINAEIEAGKNLHHPGIVTHLGYIETEKYEYIILEYFQSSDLLTNMEMRQFKPFNESQARDIFSQLLNCVIYIHQERYVHRDIKLENILINEAGIVKLVDFGFSTKISFVNPLLDRYMGSQDYVAPEILSNHPYDGFKADVWSLGTILFTLLFGELPFIRDERIISAVRDIPHPLIKWPNIRVSSEAKDLVIKMLNPDPNKRISTFIVTKHSWMNNNLKVEPAKSNAK